MPCSFEEQAAAFRMDVRTHYSYLFSTRGEAGKSDMGEAPRLSSPLQPQEGRAAAAKVRVDKKIKPENASKLGFSKLSKMLRMLFTCLKGDDKGAFTDAQQVSNWNYNFEVKK